MVLSRINTITKQIIEGYNSLSYICIEVKITLLFNRRDFVSLKQDLTQKAWVIVQRIAFQ